MNRIRISALIALALASTGAVATEFGRVISSTPVMVQTATPQRQCAYGETVVVQQQSNGTGAVIGGVVGGLVGNNLGNHGGNRAATTALGFIGGAFAGNAIEQSNQQPQVVSGTRCRTMNVVSDQIVGYDVVYEYSGNRYRARMNSEPGRRIALEVTVRPAMDQGRNQRFDGPIDGARIEQMYQQERPVPIHRDPAFQENSYQPPAPRRGGYSQVAYQPTYPQQQQTVYAQQSNGASMAVPLVALGVAAVVLSNRSHDHGHQGSRGHRGNRG